MDSGADMAAVTKVLEQKYPGPGGVNAWFGHPTRLTVEGKPVEQEVRARTDDPPRA